MKVYDAVANAFVKEEATTVFGLLGDGQLTWWAAMARHPGVRLIDAREEGSGLAMAEGYARVSGRVGVCSVTHGPGLARLSLSLIAAARSRTPIVVHTATTKFNDERETQYLNQDRFVTAAECGYIEVMKPDYAEEAVRQAFYRARTESRPIVLSIPMDVVGKECDSDGEDYIPSAALFGGQQKIRPAVDRVEAAARIISEAKRPVIVLGRGAMDAQAREAADRMKQTGIQGAIVLVSTMQAVGVFPGSTPYAAQKAALIHAARILAKECRGRTNIRVNVICPGVNQAGMAEASIASGKYDRYLADDVIPRFGHAGDVARAVRFFLEEDSYITGEVLTIDGGLTL